MSKIIDDAREKIAECLYNDSTHYEYEWDYVKKRQPSLLQMFLGKAAHVLALSGTTDIECPDCGGSGHLQHKPHKHSRYLNDCPKCENGVIKHKWKVSVTLENGELPKSPDTEYVIAQYAGEEATPEDVALMHLNGIEKGKSLMLNAKYRQVVE